MCVATQLQQLAMLCGMSIAPAHSSRLLQSEAKPQTQDRFHFSRGHSLLGYEDTSACQWSPLRPAGVQRRLLRLRLFSETHSGHVNSDSGVVNLRSTSPQKFVPGLFPESVFSHFPERLFTCPDSAGRPVSRRKCGPFLSFFCVSSKTGAPREPIDSGIFILRFVKSATRSNTRICQFICGPAERN
jgi:hypothetical protein